MNINKKIRRAFQKATPDVLGTLSVHDAPKPVQKRKKLSDRAVEFIATAASLALLISAVGGGFAYYRNFYAGNTGTSAVPTTTTQMNAPAEPEDTAPWSTEPVPTAPPDGRWPAEAILEAALTYAGLTAEDVTDVTCVFDDTNTEYHCYRVSFTADLCRYEITVNAYTGVIMMIQTDSISTDTIPALEARDIALAAANADLAEVYYLTVAFCEDQVLGFEATDDPLYCVCLEFSTYSYTVIIDSATGDILDCQSIEIPEKHDDPGLIGWASARDAALKAAGVSLDRLAHLYCSYDGSGAYDVQFMCNSMGHDSNLYTYRIDASTSDVMTDAWIPEIPEVGSEFCTPKDAINHALNTAVYGDKDFVHIECIQLGSEQGRCFYLVIMENYLYCMIDANTMQHLDVSAPFPTDVLDQHTAAKQAIRVVGADEWDDWMLMLKGVYSDGQPYYCFLYDYEGVMHVCVVDAYTGDLLATATHQWILGHAADIPMYAALQHLGLALEDVTDLEYEYDTVTDPEYPRHWICFRHNGQSYRIAVGGHVKTRLQILEVQTEKIG